MVPMQRSPVRGMQYEFHAGFFLKNKFLNFLWIFTSLLSLRSSNCVAILNKKK
jgi:hypothetical protein